MQITVIDVGAPNTHAAKNGRSYQSMEVTYKNEQGQTQSKKLMSFSNPEVFKQAKDWKKGDSVNVNMTKDDAGYWQWVSIGEAGSAPASPPQAYSGKPQAAGTRVTGSNYETPEERAKKQVYIVRQSSISSAIELLKSNGNDVKVDNVLSVAKQLEDYVFGNTTGVDAINSMQDDVPV
jgi:hypothetical protein